MPTIKMGPLGVSGGIPGGNGGQPGKRERVNGWSRQSARGNTRFLRSVCDDQLPDYGLAFTFTVRDAPTPDQWAKLKKKVVRAMSERLGCVCWHMVTEWTKQGRPHLHGCAFWLDFSTAYYRDLMGAWLKYSAEFGTLNRGQMVKQIDGSAGWFMYMAKHASRGMGHYQREADNLPPEWKLKTGRVWSRGGRWPTRLEENDLTYAEFYLFRRLLDRHVRSEARTKLQKALKYGDPKQIAGARKRLVFLKLLRKSFGGGHRVSATRGINQWVPAKVSGPLLRFAFEQTQDPDEAKRFTRALEAQGMSEMDVPF